LTKLYPYLNLFEKSSSFFETINPNYFSSSQKHLSLHILFLSDFVTVSIQTNESLCYATNNKRTGICQKFTNIIADGLYECA